MDDQFDLFNNLLNMMKLLLLTIQKILTIHAIENYIQSLGVALSSSTD